MRPMPFGSLVAAAVIAAVAPATSAAPAVAAPPPGHTSTAAPAATPAPPAVPVQTLLDGVGPLVWNATVDADGSLKTVVPHWPAVRVLAPIGTESLFVFTARAAEPMLLASWPRGSGYHAVRIFPGYRWIVVESPDTAAAPADTVEVVGADSFAEPPKLLRFHAANGSLLAEARAAESPAPLGRNLLLWPRKPSAETEPPTLSVRRMPEGDDRASWSGVAGWGASSPLENFLAANTIGLMDPATGLRQDELRLIDLEGKVLWTRTVGADQREFAVSNHGHVAIARDKQLLIYDRSGAEKLKAPLPRNVVGRTAIGSDGRFAIVAARSPVGGPEGGLWVALYDTSHRPALWTRRNLGTKSSDALELSVSDDGLRTLLRLSTGQVLLLGRDGATLAEWSLPRVSRGEYEPGTVPRRTWLSADGTLVALTTPVARTLADARGRLYRVPR